MSDSILPGAFQTDSNVLNVPIFFFFQLGKAQLTDDSQLINLDELAKVATSHNLKVNIAGAADSATGSRDINTELSEERARYITQELMKRGVPSERIKSISLGGIQEYSNPKDNRYCKVSLYLEMETLP
jgi:outer membrane protein OmpA-like peptidoglycan-associated protein